MSLPQNPPIRSVMIAAKTDSPEGPGIAAELDRWLRRHGVGVYLDTVTAGALGRSGGVPREDPPDDVELIVAAGGDGTLLAVARTAVPRGLPILGVNFGSLGFLSELQPDELVPGLEAVLAGDYAIEDRHALRVRYRPADGGESEYALLNDVVLAKGALARMVTIAVEVDGEPVATYTSDGLIVSTPTGSTAYNLSAGGPILDPRMEAFVVAPICPHTMTYRPLVVPSSVTIDVGLRSSEKVFLTLDGQIGYPFRSEDRLRIDRHPSPVRLVRVAGLGFFEILRRKLRWGER